MKAAANERPPQHAVGWEKHHSAWRIWPDLQHFAFWIVHEAQGPWASCSPELVPGLIRRKLPWTPECRWSQLTWWLPAKKSSHGHKSFPCASCPGTSTAPSQKCQHPAELWMFCLLPAHDGSRAWLFYMDGRLSLHLHPGATMSRWRNAGWVIEDTAGARRGHVLRGMKIIWDICSCTLLRYKKTINVGNSLQVWATCAPFVVSEWNRKQQKSVRWHKTRGSKYMF